MKSMADIKELAQRLKKGPTDVVGVDVGETAIALARMKKTNDLITLLAVDIVPLPPELAQEQTETVPDLQPLIVPPKLKGKYASLAVAGTSAIMKILTFPGHFDEAAEAKVVENMGIENPDKYRISYKLVSEGHGRSEARVLTVALPEAVAQAPLRLFPIGIPAPYSLEISGLATLTAFLHSQEKKIQDASVGIIDFGAEVCTFGLFHKGFLMLVRRFPVGTNSILNKVQETLGVDQETAQGIISDGSFDISQSVSDVMEPLIKQLIVSRDYVERRENCQVSRIYISGGLVVSRDLVDEMKSSMGIEVTGWNPFDELGIAAGALPENFAGQEWRFAAAVGACLATFEGT
jgi:Tfp pilus assembly PilM family ATPase